MNFFKRGLIAFIAGLGIFTMGAGHAQGLRPDSASIEVGYGDDDLIVTRVGVQWDWNQHWFNSNGTSLDGYFDLNAAWWHADEWKGSNDDKDLAVIGFTPVFRFGNTNKKGPYIEAGVGVSFFSKVYRGGDKNMGISFQFADHIGVGYVFDNNIDLSVRFQHYSNAGISDHNSGVNLVFLRGAYRW